MKKKKEICGCNSKSYNSCGGWVYCMAFIGALVYNLSNATGFWNAVVGILKAMVWPAFVVFELMKFLGM